MCWEWLERGRLEEAIDEEARLLEREDEPEAAEQPPVEDEELVPA